MWIIKINVADIKPLKTGLTAFPYIFRAAPYAILTISIPL
jgi:hypothetical protein